MAAVVEYARDVSVQISSSGTTVVREKQIYADSMSDIVANNLLPQHGSRHPVFTHLRLTDCSFSPSGNTSGKVQGVCSATYTSTSTSFSSQSSAKEPWEMGATGLSSQPFSYQVPLLSGYVFKNRKLVTKQLKNTAGCRIEATVDKYGTDYNFVFAAKNEPHLPDHPIINNNTAKVAGMIFPHATLMLMPPSKSKIADRDDNGKLIREYWEVSINLRYKEDMWWREFLNVGTLARFPDEDGTLSAPQPIYKYFPWEEFYSKTDPNAKYEAPPKYGSLQDVILTKEAYALVVCGGYEPDDEKWQRAYSELPYEEMTEALPLNTDGTVYMEAMLDPDNNPYKTVGLYEYYLTDFSSYDLPLESEE